MSLSIRRVAAGAVLAVVLAAGVRRPTGDGGAGGSNPHLPPRRRGPGAVLPVRLVDTSPRYVDAATGDEVTLVTPETHHRDETRTAIADPWLLARAALERGPYTLDLRAGVTVPLARPEEDPFAAEAMGAEHEHIQFGTGTFNPVLGAEGHYLADRFSLGVWGVTQQVLYESAKGYQAGDRYAAGAAVESRLRLPARGLRGGPGGAAVWGAPRRGRTGTGAGASTATTTATGTGTATRAARTGRGSTWPRWRGRARRGAWGRGPARGPCSASGGGGA